jgi:hypothetical protein
VFFFGKTVLSIWWKSFAKTREPYA